MQNANPASSPEQEFESEITTISSSFKKFADITPEIPAISFIIHSSPRNLNLLWCPQGQLVDVGPSGTIRIEHRPQIVVRLWLLTANTPGADPMRPIHGVLRLLHGVVADPRGNGTMWHEWATTAGDATTHDTHVSPDLDICLAKVFGELEAVVVACMPRQIHQARPNTAPATWSRGFGPQS